MEGGDKEEEDTRLIEFKKRLNDVNERVKAWERSKLPPKFLVPAKINYGPR